MNIKKELVDYMISNLEGFKMEYVEDNLIDLGLIDSLQIVQLLAFIEDEYHITIDVDDIDPDNFSSVDTIVQLIQNYM